MIHVLQLILGAVVGFGITALIQHLLNSKNPLDENLNTREQLLSEDKNILKNDVELDEQSKQREQIVADAQKEETKEMTNQELVDFFNKKK